MRYSSLKHKISTPIFFDYQVARLFPNDSKNLIHTQLSRMAHRGDLLRLKRGIFAFPDRPFDELFLAQILYRPSYVSLETALFHFGIIPEAAQAITSVSTTTTKKIRTELGIYLYSKISQELYYGYEYVQDLHSKLYYPIAYPEKALLDFIYIRKITELDGSRIDSSGLDRLRLDQFASYYPIWVRKAIDE